MFYSYILFGLFILLFFLYKLFSKHVNYWPKRNVSKLSVNFIMQFLFRKPVSDMDIKIYKDLGNKPFGGFSNFGMQALFVKDLDLLRKILVKDFDHFTSMSFSGKDHEDDYTSSMLSMEKGLRWKKLRSTLSPIFTTGKIKRMSPIFESCGQNFTKYLETISDGGRKPVDIQKATERFTMSVIASAVFAIDANTFSPGNESPIFIQQARKLMKFDIISIFRFIIVIGFPFLAKLFKVTFLDVSAQKFFAKIIKDAIAHREKSGDKWDDFLQLMLEHKQSEGKEAGNEILEDFEKDAQINVKTNAKLELDERTLVAQCLQFLFAGFDTTESLLTWAFYEMAINQDIQDKLRKELKQAKEENDGKLNYEAVMNNEYLDNIITETLRKYPPSTRGGRVVEKDYRIEEYGITLEKGVNIFFPIYAIHHDPNIWPEPEKFNPDRFLRSQRENRHPYAWLPFGSGPRSCIGNRFALAEAKIMLANLILKFRIEPTAKTQIPAKFLFSIFLKPKESLELKLTNIE